MAQLKDSLITGDLRVTGTIYGDANLSSLNASGTGLGTNGQILTSTGTGLAWSNNVAPSSHTHAAGDITSGTLGIARGGTGLSASPSMLTDLSSTTAANVLQASPRPGITGTLGLGNGGTGATTAANAVNNLLSGAPNWTAVPTDSTYFIRQDTGGSNSFGKAPFSTVWTYIKGKADSVYAASDHNHDSTYVNVSGDTMTGALTLSGAPTANLHAATKQYVDQSFAANDAMIFKGTIGSSGATVTALPATHNAGWTYRVITAGTYAGVACEIGDLIICITDGTSANNAHWTVAQTNIDGAVIGPSSVTSGHVVTFNGGTGKLIQDSGYTIASNVPANAKFTDTNYYHTTGSWNGLTYTATANGGAGALAFTIPTGTNATTVAVGNHTHDKSTVTSVYEANLEWGGKNFSASYGPIDAAMIQPLGANRFAFLKPAGLTIEYSTDGGSTWTDYGANNTQKTGLFGRGQGFILGKHTTAGTNTTNDQLRVTISTSEANLYTVLNKIAIYMSTSGNTVQVKMEKALQSTPTSFSTHLDWTGISGWSGWNILNINGVTTYGNSAGSQYGKIRFIFKQTAVNTNYSSASISRIMGFGGQGWTVPSNMATDGHLYSYDNDQNAVFPAKVTATTLAGNLDWSYIQNKPTLGTLAAKSSISDHSVTTPTGATSRTQDVTLKTTTVNSITGVGTLPSLTVTATDVVTGGTTTDIPNITKKTVVTGVTKKTVVTGGSTTDVPNITKKTVVTSATAAKATYANGILTISDGSVTTGDSVTVGTAIKAYTSLTTGDSVTVTTGDSVTVGTAIKAYTALTTSSIGSASGWSAGTLPTKGSNTTVATGINKQPTFTVTTQTTTLTHTIS